MLVLCAHYCTGRQFYYVTLIDKKLDIKNILTFGVMTPQTWSRMNKVAYLGLINSKRKQAMKFLMPDLNFTQKIPPDSDFQSYGGVPLQICDPLNIVFRIARHF